uniref:PPIase cyclophilin-type domain-containing protein n=2 Tax=Canis lupus familiaris TaxID=9615 RepID=A0A8C0MG72_CANLF
MSVTLHTDVGDIKIEVFCERTPKTCENFLVPEEEVTVSGARNLRMNIVNILSTMLGVLYQWLIMAQTPMDLSSSSPMANSHIWT